MSNYNSNRSQNNDKLNPIYIQKSRHSTSKLLFRGWDFGHSMLEILVTYNNYSLPQINLIITPIAPQYKFVYDSSAIRPDEKRWMYSYEIWMQLSDIEIIKIIAYLEWLQYHFTSHVSEDIAIHLKRDLNKNTLAKYLANLNYNITNDKKLETKNIILGYGNLNSNITQPNVHIVDKDYYGNPDTPKDYYNSICLCLYKSIYNHTNVNLPPENEGYYFHFLPEIFYFPDETYGFANPDLDGFLHALKSSFEHKHSIVGLATDRIITGNGGNSGFTKKNYQHQAPENAMSSKTGLSYGAVDNGISSPAGATFSPSASSPPPINQGGMSFNASVFGGKGGGFNQNVNPDDDIGFELEI